MGRLFEIEEALERVAIAARALALQCPACAGTGIQPMWPGQDGKKSGGPFAGKVIGHTMSGLITVLLGNDMCYIAQASPPVAADDPPTYAEFIQTEDGYRVTSMEAGEPPYDRACWDCWGYGCNRPKYPNGGPRTLTRLDIQIAYYVWAHRSLRPTTLLVPFEFQIPVAGNWDRPNVMGALAWVMGHPDASRPEGVVNNPKFQWTDLCDRSTL